VSGDGVVELRRRLPAPVAEVFRWWTQPELLCEWMSPSGTAEVKMDLRVGGAMLIVMKHEGTVVRHVCEFLEVVPPTRLVFSWSSPYTGAQPSIVTLELEPDGESATNLSLVHNQLPEEAAESHRGGWGAILDRLAGGLTPQAAEMESHRAG
jgi:uncharacterized protein YndB with AHSA1/START domain